MIIRALRSITDNDVDGTTVLRIFDGLFVLSNVVWSESDNKLTLSNAPQSVGEEFGGVDDRSGTYSESSRNWSCSNGVSWYGDRRDFLI